MLVEAAGDRAGAAMNARDQSAPNGDSAPAAETKNTLADRIRALQLTASRVAWTN